MSPKQQKHSLPYYSLIAGCADMRLSIARLSVCAIEVSARRLCRSSPGGATLWGQAIWFVLFFLYIAPHLSHKTCCDAEAVAVALLLSSPSHLRFIELCEVVFEYPFCLLFRNYLLPLNNESAYVLIYYEKAMLRSNIGYMFCVRYL